VTSSRSNFFLQRRQLGANVLLHLCCEGRPVLIRPPAGVQTLFAASSTAWSKKKFASEVDCRKTAVRFFGSGQQKILLPVSGKQGRTCAAFTTSAAAAAAFFASFSNTSEAQRQRVRRWEEETRSTVEETAALKAIDVSEPCEGISDEEPTILYSRRMKVP